MDHHFKLNSLFNQIGGNLTLSEMARHASMTTDTEYLNYVYQIAARQTALIAEEFQELLDGHDSRDITEIRDGLGDTIVTVDGLFYRLGLNYPDTSKWCEHPAHPNVALDYAQCTLQALQTAVGDKVSVSHERIKTMFAAMGTGILLSMYQLAQNYGIDLHADQEAIFRSNMSKYDTDEETAIAGIIKYANLNVKAELAPIETDGVIYHVIRCTESAIGSDGKQYKVGKILKSVNFKEPQLAPLPADAPLNSLFT